MPTPEVILVDLSEEEQPINALGELAEVVEPGTIVLAIGAIQNVNFYRTVTKGLGIREYLAKPLQQRDGGRALSCRSSPICGPPPPRCAAAGW